MQQILVLNGPNLNLLGTREPEIYGTTTLSELEYMLTRQASDNNVDLACKQTNSESELINIIQEASADKVAFLILNAAAYTHTSVALRDALLGARIPFIEVHISNPHKREDFRKQSYLADIASGIIAGLGIYGYQLALQAAIKFLNNKSD